MNKWIRVADRLPEATSGEAGKPPILSDDVLILFETGVDVANYDHEDGKWALINRSFSEPDCDPLFWMPIPDYPEGFRLSQ